MTLINKIAPPPSVQANTKQLYNLDKNIGGCAQEYESGHQRSNMLPMPLMSSQANISLKVIFKCGLAAA